MQEVKTLSDYLPFLIPVLLLQLALLVVALADVLQRDQTRLLNRYVWVVIIAFFGIVGPIVYLLAGREE